MQVPAALLRPRELRYQSIDKIGRGSFGRVSMGIDLLTHRHVAIKLQKVPSTAAARH